MIDRKLKSPKELKKIVLSLKKKGKKIAFTNGCFDILHLGHVRYLEQAKKTADILLVALNTDASVKRLKGKKRPIFGLKDRMRVVAALESVDYVTYFSQDTPAEIINFLRPDLVVKGGDYNIKNIVGAAIVKRYGGRAQSLDFHKGYSVTSVIERILKICAASGR